MDLVRKNRQWTLPAAAFVVAVVAIVACGAASAPAPQKSAGPAKAAPLAPLTYDPRLSLAPLVDKVSAAVVNIRVEARVERGPRSFEGLDPFEFFFGPRMRPGPGRGGLMRAQGSGFIVDASGLVVTNHHVVERADKLEVQLADERVFPAELVGSDPRTDVALLRLLKGKSEPRDLPVVAFGDSDTLQVGDHVVAIGNPFGLDHTVTAGIVSAKERVIGAGPYDEFIQTDASINPGNSGGPLFDLAGRVVGINTAIAPQGQGIGFAIPARLASSIIDSLKQGGKVVRGFLGVAFQPVDEALAGALGLGDENGALVSEVTPGSPAAQAGIVAGDVIVGVDGKRLASGRQLAGLVAALGPGRSVPFLVVREGRERTIPVTIGELPGEGAGGAKSKDAKLKGALGFEVGELDARLATRLGAEGLRGVLVTRVAPDGPASEALQGGDLIVEANRAPITSPADFAAATAKLRSGDDLLLRVYRQGGFRYVVIRL